MTTQAKKLEQAGCDLAAIPLGATHYGPAQRQLTAAFYKVDAEGAVTHICSTLTADKWWPHTRPIRTLDEMIAIPPELATNSEELYAVDEVTRLKIVGRIDELLDPPGMTAPEREFHDAMVGVVSRTWDIPREQISTRSTVEVDRKALELVMDALTNCPDYILREMGALREHESKAISTLLKDLER